MKVVHLAQLFPDPAGAPFTDVTRKKRLRGLFLPRQLRSCRGLESGSGRARRPLDKELGPLIQ